MYASVFCAYAFISGLALAQSVSLVSIGLFAGAYSLSRLFRSWLIAFSATSKSFAEGGVNKFTLITIVESATRFSGRVLRISIAALNASRLRVSCRSVMRYMSWRTSLKSVWGYCDFHLSMVASRLSAAGSFTAESYNSYSLRSLHSGFLSCAARPGTMAHAIAHTIAQAARVNLDCTNILHVAGVTARNGAGQRHPRFSASIPDAPADPQATKIARHNLRLTAPLPMVAPRPMLSHLARAGRP